MPFMYRFKVNISGFPGAPGVILFHTTTGVADDPGDMGNFMNQIYSMLVDFQPYYVGGLLLNVDSEVTKHDVATGMLVGVFSLAPPAQVMGSSSLTQTSRATQLVVRLNTDATTDRGKRLVGRHFIGPIASNALTSAGSILPAIFGQAIEAYQGMLDVAGTTRLIVWHRPAPAYTKEDGTEVPATVGAFGHVTSVSALPLPGVLRSRRD